MIYKCLVVDDEPIAQQILENYISQMESLQLMGKCSNAFEALNMLHKEPIDILFLDIKMPTMSGLEMLKTLQNPPKVILTTAFSEYGVESYDYGIVDYLLKPIPFDRFLRAVNRIVMNKNADAPQPDHNSENLNSESKFIFFKADKKIHKFNYEDIFHLEGFGNYVKVYSSHGSPLLVLEKLSDLEEKLPRNLFQRVHKSFIINLLHIGEIEGNRVKIKNADIPISASYKAALQEWIGKV